MDLHEVFYSTQTVVIITVTILSFSTSGFLIVYLTRHLRKIHREYITYRSSFVVDYVVRGKMLFNYKTVIYKNGILILILFLEMSFYVFITFCLGLAQLVKNNIRNYNTSYLGCELRQSFIKAFYLEPVTTLFPITIVVLLVTLLLLFSFLSTFLSRRYYGYSLDKCVVSKYIAWWLLQIVLLLFCVILYLQAFFLFLTPLFLFTDWFILLKESLKLSRHIQAIVFEIKQFENDPVRYRAAYSSYRTYKIFISIELLILVSIIIMFTLVAINTILELVLIDNCYLKLVYNIDISSSVAESDSIYRIFRQVIGYSRMLLEVLYCVLLILPQCIIIIPWLVYVLYKRVTIRKYPIRFNYESFRPLLMTEH